tara:strand:- start:1792 stop:2331 length:540 start_codon:yes stop_codon:yes gene_type:complete
MIELLEWFQQLNAHDLRLADLKSESSIFFAYVILGLFIKKPVLPLAFLSCYVLVNASFFQFLSEYQVYLIVCVMYSYTFETCLTRQSKIACGIILFISITFAIDAILYGVNGYYGAHQTVIYNNIEYIATCGHIIFISSFISIERILNSFRSFIDSIVRITANSDYMLVYMYNNNKAIK